MNSSRTPLTSPAWWVCGMGLSVRLIPTLIPTSGGARSGGSLPSWAVLRCRYSGRCRCVTMPFLAAAAFNQSLNWTTSSMVPCDSETSLAHAKWNGNEWTWPRALAACALRHTPPSSVAAALLQQRVRRVTFVGDSDMRRLYYSLVWQVRDLPCLCARAAAAAWGYRVTETLTCSDSGSGPGRLTAVSAKIRTTHSTHASAPSRAVSGSPTRPGELLYTRSCTTYTDTHMYEYTHACY